MSSSATAATGLDALFSPASVAVVGASENPAKWGYQLAIGALSGRDRRTVHLVNRRPGSLRHQPFAPSLSALPAAPEHVVVAVPPPYVDRVIGEGLELGCGCFTVITSTGSTAAEERRLARDVTARGARLLGPNCMGVVDASSQLNLSWGDFPTGGVGLVSQSGNLALEIGRLLARADQGFSRFVSLGNQRDIDAADAIEALISHEPTRAIAAYIEDFHEGRRLARVLAAAHAAGKPVMLLTVGDSAASARAAASHTGALVSTRTTVDAMCRESGAILLRSAGELVDTALYLMAHHRRTTRPPRSADAGTEPALRVAIVGDSGGHGALAADTFTGQGMDVPPLGAAAQEILRAHLPGRESHHNPVDLAGAGESDLAAYARVTAGLLNDTTTDAVVLTGYFGDYATANPAQRHQECQVAHELADACDTAGRPLIVHTMARDTPTVSALRRRGVPVYERIEQAAGALAAAHRITSPTPPLPPAPPARRTLSDAHYETAREMLSSYGLRFPAAEFVHDVDTAVTAAQHIGYPLALKAMGLAHKTEAGGVALDLRDEAALRTAFARMSATTGSASYAVEAMVRAPHSHELIIGVRRDPSFGPIVMVGIGGVTAELTADTAVALAPLTHAHAKGLLLRLRHAPLLTGWRGAPAVHLDAAAQAVQAVAQAAAEHGELTALEVNPLLVHPHGATALDAHGVLSTGDSGSVLH
ncbi:acetate--CoA ligase family protein [Streptomyces violaceusniger]|uniref:acetate--CoA ligase family protein n=1 Tax=Streptomyces violaceusniger TaxID=68280 RepID=UPI003421293C